jgi:TRAP-type mannitol/chloroaromatic compound transport system permease large subunit
VKETYDRFVRIFAVVFIVLGFVMLVRTASEGGGIGFVIGALFIALGAARLYLLRRG